MEAEKVRLFYNKIAQEYLLERYCDSKRKFYQELEARIVRDLVDFKGKDVLDLGTGTGWFIPEIAEEAERIIGVDFSEEMIKIARAENKFPNTNFLVMDARNLGFPRQCFDIVLSLGMFEYVTDLSPFLEEVHRVLKCGGDFIFTCPNKYYLFLPFITEKLPFRKSKHSLDKLAQILDRFGFRMIRHISIFYIFPLSFYSSTFVEFSIRINKLLAKAFPRNGKTLVIHAKKVGPRKELV